VVGDATKQVYVPIDQSLNTVFNRLDSQLPPPETHWNRVVLEIG
jgi:hypothetical protein